MSETKHTLPYMISIDGLHLEYFHDVQSNGRDLEIIFESVRDADTKKTVCRLTGHVDTNVAKLFAAAPDMLAALKAFPDNGYEETYLSYVSRVDRWLTYVANPAIAKAEGGAK